MAESEAELKGGKGGVDLERSRSAKDEDEDEDLNKCILSLNDDLIATILSYLSVSDLSVCASVNRRLKALCSDDRKVWKVLCEKRWGHCTNIREWVPGPVTFRVLYGALAKFERLVGIWRSVGDCQFSSIVSIGWKPAAIEGMRVVLLPGPESHEILKVPFLQVSLTADGAVKIETDSHWSARVCRMMSGPSIRLWESVSQALTDAAPSHSANAIDGGGRTSPSHLTIGNGTTAEDVTKQSRGGGGGVFEGDGLGFGSRSVQPASVGFVSDRHFIIDEKPVQSPRAKSRSPLVEAAVQTSLCSSKNGGRRGSYGDEYCSTSPPGSFGYEMYEYMSNKVTSPGGDKAGRKQRRKEKAERQRRESGCAEHFVKVIDIRPTIKRPLQGFWRCADGPFGGQDIILLSYDDDGCRHLICRKLAGSTNESRNGTVQWRANAHLCMASPLSLKEQLLHDQRRCISAPRFNCPPIQGFSASVRIDHGDDKGLPRTNVASHGSETDPFTIAAEDGDDDGDEEGGTAVLSYVDSSTVIAAFRTIGEEGDVSLGTVNEQWEGRLWQYADGHLAHSMMDADYMVEYRRVAEIC